VLEGETRQVPVSSPTLWVSASFCCLILLSVQCCIDLYSLSAFSAAAFDAARVVAVSRRCGRRPRRPGRRWLPSGAGAYGQAVHLRLGGGTPTTSASSLRLHIRACYRRSFASPLPEFDTVYRSFARASRAGPVSAGLARGGGSGGRERGRLLRPPPPLSRPVLWTPRRRHRVGSENTYAKVAAGERRGRLRRLSFRLRRYRPDVLGPCLLTYGIVPRDVTWRGIDDARVWGLSPPPDRAGRPPSALRVPADNRAGAGGLGRRLHTPPLTTPSSATPTERASR